MQLLVRPAAAADIEEAFLWYERKRPGLGEDFLGAVQTTLDEVTAHPARYPVIHRDTSRKLVLRFPYAVFYRTYGEAVVVVACMHMRRDPLQWKSRT